MKVPAFVLDNIGNDLSGLLADMQQVLESGLLTLGPQVKAFEEEFASMVGTTHCVAVSSGTAALEILLLILNPTGGAVLIPGNTNFATAAAVIRTGGRCCFVDINRESLGFDLQSLDAALGPDSTGAICVHIGGLVSQDHDAVAQICRRRGLFLIEDASHAHGSVLHGRRAGSLADAAAFSLFPTKIVTSGEGGVLATDDSRIATLAKSYRDQGKAPDDPKQSAVLGDSWRMSELQAALGRQSLARIRHTISDRTRIARTYDEKLVGHRWLRPIVPPEGVKTNYYKYIVELTGDAEPRQVRDVLRRDFGISLPGEVYSLPCYDHPAFRDWIELTDPLPNTEHFCAHHVCLPIYGAMTEGDAEYVSASVLACVRALEGVA